MEGTGENTLNAGEADLRLPFPIVRGQCSQAAQATRSIERHRVVVAQHIAYHGWQACHFMISLVDSCSIRSLDFWKIDISTMRAKFPKAHNRRIGDLSG